MGKPTPGPWAIDGRTIHGPYIDKAHWLIAKIVSNEPTDTANAQLIIAAPCMLEALQELTADITGSAVLMDHITLARFERAVAVITKATEGRS